MRRRNPVGRKVNFFSQGDKYLLILPLVLSLFGLLAIFDSSVVAALRDFNDKFHYLRNQAIWLAIGWCSFIFFSLIDCHFFKKIATPLFFFSLTLLVLVLFPVFGKQVYGGRRWFQVGGFVFQPAELTKFSLILYFSSLFEKRKELLPFITIVGLVLTLLILEPDLGTAIIITSTALALWFVAGASWKQIIFLIASSMITGLLLIFISPYRKQRLLSFFNFSSDVQGSSYHIRQILIALGAGGILGRGFGQSRQKFLFLPEVTTDSIFAVIAEEFGLVGATVLFLVLLFLVYRMLKISILIKEPFFRLIVIGFAFSLGIQTVINLCSMVALFPLTGVPLPFISYGGSSLVVSLAGMGIVYNISKKVK